MQWKYKILMFLTLLIFCVGSVCAADPDEDNSVIVAKLTEKNAQLNETVTNQSIEIKQLKTENKKLSNKIDSLNIKINSLETKNNGLTEKVNSLENDIKNLKDDNKQLRADNKALNNTINELRADNKALNNTINELRADNKALNAKLDLQVNEIKGLQADKDKLNAEINKLNAEIKENYKKLLFESPEKEDFDQLKKEIDNKNKQIDKLNNEISTLKAILSVNGKDVYNSLKGLSSTKNIKCGKYTFKLEDYLKIPLIKDGKNRVLKYKKDNGRLPNYVTIAGYEVPKNVYKKLYNL